MAPHSSILAWKIPWMEEPGGLQSMGSLRIGHDGATSLSLFTFMHWRRKWQPTPVFLPGESQGQRSLVGCHLWGCTVGQLKQLSCSSRCGLRSLLQVGTLGWQRRENLKTNFIHLSTFLQALTLKRASLVAWW